MKKLLTALSLLAATTLSSNAMSANCQYYQDQGNYWAEMSLTLMVAGYDPESAPVKYAQNRMIYWNKEAAKCDAQK